MITLQAYTSSVVLTRNQCYKSGVAQLFCLLAKFCKDIVLQTGKFFWACFSKSMT
jgi:hypothetical protein